MPNLAKLPTWSEDGDLHVVVETPRGARAKLKYEPELKSFVLSKSLLLGLTYPYDWGFIPSTSADDGDPIDVMVIHDAATSPGLLMRCKIIGVLETLQKQKGKEIRNDRVFAVPQKSHRGRDIDEVRDLAPETRTELEKFFVATDELEAKQLTFLGWAGAKQAHRFVKSCQKRFAKR
jgi:inorganic pyrophosphatase